MTVTSVFTSPSITPNTLLYASKIIPPNAPIEYNKTNGPLFPKRTESTESLTAPSIGVIITPKTGPMAHVIVIRYTGTPSLSSRGLTNTHSTAKQNSIAADKQAIAIILTISNKLAAMVLSQLYPNCYRHIFGKITVIYPMVFECVDLGLYK